MCGGDARECQNPRYQHAYAAEYTRCYRTRAIASASQSRRDTGPDMRALVVSTRLLPERIKPAT